MRMLIVFCFIFHILYNTSCVSYEKCISKYPPSRDTTYIEKIKKVEILVPGDTISIEVPTKCPDQDVYLVENSKLKQTIRILNGKLSSVTTIKPDTIKVSITEIKTVVKEVSKPVKYTPKFYIYCTWLLIGLVVAVLGYTAWKIFK